MSQCLITNQVNLYHLVEVVSAGFTHHKVTVFPLLFISILGEILYTNNLFCLILIPADVLFIGASCLQQLLRSCNGDFLFPHSF